MDGVEAIHTIHPGFEERSIAKAPFRNSYFLVIPDAAYWLAYQCAEEIYYNAAVLYGCRFRIVIVRMAELIPSLALRQGFHGNPQVDELALDGQSVFQCQAHWPLVFITVIIQHSSPFYKGQSNTSTSSRPLTTSLPFISFTTISRP